MMLLRTITYATAIFLGIPALAQSPLYIVNGREMDDIRAIPPSDIEKIETVEINEESIAKYGTEANHGVIIVTLKYDEPARFQDDSISYNDYIADRVKWGDNEPVARVAIRYTIGTDGKVTLGDVLESTDNRLRRKIVAAVEEAPAWIPAKKEGKPVESERVLQIQLPRGRRMPREPYVVIR